MSRAFVSSSFAMALVALTLGACAKVKEDKQAETAQSRAEAKRHKEACASKSAYDHMKRVIFDQARGQQGSHRTNLDTLESFSLVRMEEPVVEGWDPALDITRCRGRFILDAPPGSERALGGERRLTAEIAYTAQAAADASGLVYVIEGAEPIVRRLAAFDLPDATYRPLPALDAEPETMQVASVDDASMAAPRTIMSSQEDEQAPDARRDDPVPQSASATRAALMEEARSVGNSEPSNGDAAGKETVSRFYNALGAGNGQLASAQVIPTKRSSRAYSADAISRFYGRLSDPLRLTGIRPLPGGAYRVTYRYAGTGIRCNGTATVRLSRVGGRPLIRSILAENGC
jgi:hypothetical protein